MQSLHHMRLAGRTHEMADLTVSARRILPGEVLRAEDLRPVRVRAATIRAETAREPADAIGLAPRRPIAAGQPMALADLLRPAVVRKGKSVTLLLDGPGLTLAAQGQALEDGATRTRTLARPPITRRISANVGEVSRSSRICFARNSPSPWCGRTRTKGGIRANTSSAEAIAGVCAATIKARLAATRRRFPVTNVRARRARCPMGPVVIASRPLKRRVTG